QSISLLRESVGSHEQAVEVFRREGLSTQLASAEASLGASLYELALRLGGDEEMDLLAEAVAACRRALPVQARDADRQAWASTQVNLGLVLTAQAALAPPPAGAGLFEQAMAAFKLASEVYSQQG